ncbi:aminotransferase class V-fold PLP-dependent enzyme [Clostridium tyrobutyricum]|uniref:aminotransferase class V-fold PLP-dependent enzyme n=1 Tax=Clostridium tyrobutyricum TaxID=1519 RepID=UPI001C393A15|nr:aminotransferase class V-fold PLP-dependent enzyme [Clostridium tyrobutyricum]MBV4419842.1 aminotransferase class V-fold PLP-dependent enzyme [Clostridium tyrobutyricum]
MAIYLDNAATSYPKPDIVMDKMYYFMKNIGATAGRGAYKSEIESDRLVYNCRNNLCKLFNFDKPSNVVFTYNITEALNLAINGILEDGDHVITSSLEHNSVTRPLNILEKTKNIQISKVPCNAYGLTNPNDIENLIEQNTKLIIFTHASNVIGTIQPIKQIGEIARKHNILFLVDSAQTAGSYPIDVKEYNIDLLAFTGHKSLLGPTGTGGLIINCNSDIKTLKAGGTGVDSKYPYQPEYLPNKFESGTLNVVGIVGLSEGVNYINNISISSIREKEHILTEYALKTLKEIPNIIIYGPKSADKIVGVISFNIKGIPCDEVGFQLDKTYNIMVRVGFHCAPTAHRIIGTYNTGCVRIGIGYFNTKSDIDILAESLTELSKTPI